MTKPIHLNRLFREQGWIALREELGRELLDPGASAVFAVADHQIAHIYLKDPVEGRKRFGRSWRRCPGWN
ncbi:MAG: hypothetical protein MPW15_20025 [Candidatus Manganitrophus sp.]|nr:hypothetical protein [Candidatus Manganitrophus sp.]